LKIDWPNENYQETVKLINEHMRMSKPFRNPMP